jgi:zinc/manganese transport system substrate-binding protein
MKTLTFALLAAVLFATPSVAAEVQIVTTLPAYAAIAQFVGGERVEARAISRGDEDSHFVKPKPSFALMLKSADLFVTTGLDLELWAPILVDKSGNRSIRDGQPGFVSASSGVPLLDIPQSASREGGDVHIYGNPHIHTSPLNAKLIAANIAAGLIRVDASGSVTYEANLVEFQRRIDGALYGKKLVELLGAEVLDSLARKGKLSEFLENNEYQGRKLSDLLGGWLGRARAFQAREIIAYHKNWIYFTELFGLQVADYVERKPGIPPSARHVHVLLSKIQEQRIGVLLAASYFSHRQIETIAERSGCRAAIVDLGPMEINRDSYFDLVGSWIAALETAFSA